MKKKLLVILLALVLCFALVAAVACKPDEDDPKPGPGPSGDIPTEEGKVTLYWKVINSTELTDITSYFLCGTPNGWSEGNTDYELKQLDDTDTYYVFMDADTATGAEYKVVIGYNSNSPLDKAQMGPFWANEGYGSKTWAPGGENSKVPEFTGNTVDCGTIEFDGCLGDPIPVTNFDVKVSFIKGQLDTAKAEVYIMGHFSSWANKPNDAKIKAVLDTSKDNDKNLDVYKIHVAEMFAKEEAEYLVLVFPNGIGDPIEGDVDIWAYFNREGSEAIKICDFSKVKDDGSHGNAVVAVDAMYKDDYMEIGNTLSEEGVGIDLTKKVETVLKDKEGKETGSIYELDVTAHLSKIEVTLKVTFSSAIAEGLNVYIAGEGMEGLAWGDSTLKLTATDASRKTFTVKVSVLAGTKINFKIVICGETWSWDVQYGDGEGNASVTIDEAGELALFEDTLTYPKA